MIYASLHILTLIVSFYHDISYISFIVLFLILIILLSFISIYHVVIAYIVIMHEHLFFYTHTLIRSLLTTLDSYVQILDVSCYWSGVRWDSICCEELESLSFWFWYSYLSCLPVISWFSIYIRFSLYSNSLFIWCHAWIFICHIAVILIYNGLDL